MAEMNPFITTHEFPDIGHADLLECPEDAVRIVSAFFRQALDSE
jgi:pimeloyl-ACP methyl ester carboxylesterase